MEKANKIVSMLKNITIVMAIIIPLASFMYTAGKETNKNFNQSEDILVLREDVNSLVKSDAYMRLEIVEMKNIDSIMCKKLGNLEKRTLWQSEKIIEHDDKYKILSRGMLQNEKTFGEIKTLMADIKEEGIKTRESVIRQEENVNRNRDDIKYIRGRVDKLGG